MGFFQRLFGRLKGENAAGDNTKEIAAEAEPAPDGTGRTQAAENTSAQGAKDAAKKAAKEAAGKNSGKKSKKDSVKTSGDSAEDKAPEKKQKKKKESAEDKEADSDKKSDASEDASRGAGQDSENPEIPEKDGNKKSKKSSEKKSGKKKNRNKKKGKKKDKEKAGEKEPEVSELFGEDDESDDSASPTYFYNRELSWLKFNVRVLEEAEDLANPFCERLSFASIFQSNLDEFFMVRVGSLYDQMLLDMDLRDDKTNLTCEEQLLSIFSQVKLLTQRKDAVYATLDAGLKELGIEILSYSKMDGKDKEFLDAYFELSVKPMLSPLVVSKRQPFPFLKNKEIYAVAVLEKSSAPNAAKPAEEKSSGKKKEPIIGIVSCGTDVLPRLVKIPGHENRYMLIEELILHYIPQVFDQYSVTSKSLIRIIRNADIDPDEDMFNENMDFRSVMEQLINKRKRLSPVKLEYTRLMDNAVLNEIGKNLSLNKKQIFHSRSPLDLSFYSIISGILRDRRELFYPPFSSKDPAWFSGAESMTRLIKAKDRLLFYPYDSIKPFLALLDEAGEDPKVVSVKITLYRVASDSKVVEALLKAAENGKDVTVLVELRARFDEENNIGWSRRLEDAGCHIIYGLDRMKVHSKLCLITAKEGESVTYITQVGTGNYNEKTATLYTDLCLMTANQEIGADANYVFNRLSMGETADEPKLLLVAPNALRNRVLEKIDRQIALAKEGSGGYVGVKINSLTDKPIIEKLIEASEAGVKVEMVIRGICCVVAGIPQLTDNIHVRSIVGRYLEHSRIYIFGNDAEEIYISSADFMTRNTIRRVEVACPVFDSEIKETILKIFRTLMADNQKARIQLADGQYIHAPFEAGDTSVNAQAIFEKRAPANNAGAVFAQEAAENAAKNPAEDTMEDTAQDAADASAEEPEQGGANENKSEDDKNA